MSAATVRHVSMTSGSSDLGTRTPQLRSPLGRRRPPMPRVRSVAFGPSSGTVGQETLRQQRGYCRSRVAALALIAAVLVGCTSGTVAPVNAPPAGQIWFGDTYDPATFALTGRSDTKPASQQVAMVAMLSRTAHDEVLVVDIQSPQAGTLPIGRGQMKSGDNLMAYLLPALLTPGQYPVSVADSGGNTLASGTLTLR